MKHGIGLFVFVLLNLELHFGGVESVTLQFCKGKLDTKLTNQSRSDSATHAIGIRRFDFIVNSTYCNGTHGNGTFPFPPTHHQCRNDEATIREVFRVFSYQQEANLSQLSLQCQFDVFILQIDWVPLKGLVTTLTLDSLTSVCEARNTSGLNRINISNKLYDVNNSTIIANKANCACKIILPNTTRMVLHTYDNRLMPNHEMRLLYENGSNLKSWEHQSDLAHIVETEAVTVTSQILYIHWKNSAVTNGGHFWISIEAVNSSMNFICGANISTGVTHSIPTHSSTEPTTEHIELTTEHTRTVTPDSTDIPSITSDNQAYTHSVSHRISTRSTSIITFGTSSSTTPPVASGADTESTDSSNIGLIVGIVVGILVLLLLMILIACCVRWHIRKRNRTEPADDKTNIPSGDGKQNQDPHDNDTATVTTRDNSGLFAPMSKDFLSNPVNSRFSHASHTNTSNRQSSTSPVEECHESRVGEDNFEDERVDQETEVANESNPEQKKKKKKKKRRKKHRKQETMDYLLGENEQNITAHTVDD